MRLMAYIASFPDRKVALREVSEQEMISLKYLEQLAHEMVKANLLVSVRGHGGGYMLARDPGDIKAGDILRPLHSGRASTRSSRTMSEA